MTEYSKESVGRRLIGVSTYTVKEWCGGRCGMSLENAVAVCDALDWPLDRLVVRRGQ